MLKPSCSQLTSVHFIRTFVKQGTSEILASFPGCHELSNWHCTRWHEHGSPWKKCRGVKICSHRTQGYTKPVCLLHKQRELSKSLLYLKNPKSIFCLVKCVNVYVLLCAQSERANLCCKAQTLSTVGNMFELWFQLGDCCKLVLA